MQSNLENPIKKNIPKEEQTSPSFRERFNLIKDYFVNSDEKFFAWMMLLGIVLGVVTLVALTAIGGWFFTGMWAALTAKALFPFFIALGKFVGSIAAAAIVYISQSYCTGALANSWRDWLSTQFLKKLFVNVEEGKEIKTYLEVLRTCPDMKDIAQRIQEDIPEFVESSLSLGASFLKSSLSLGVFVGSLWIMGGTLAFVAFGLNIVIPGYLVWVAIIVAIAGGLITYGIGKALPKLNQKGVQAEADYRQNIEELTNNAENIGLEGTEANYLNGINQNKKTIFENTDDKTLIQSFLEGFRSFYMQLTIVIPLICSIPLLLTGLIGIEQIGQMTMYFSEVSNSLGWFAQSYEQIVNFKTKMDRIIGLDKAIDNAKTHSNFRNIAVDNIENSSAIVMKNLTILHPVPSNEDCIFRNLNLELIKGEHTLILGDSGLGKSTFFKVIKGIWAYGEGNIQLPSGKMVFFPQIPTMIKGTMMELLNNPLGKYDEQECERVLKAVKLDQFIPDLNKKDNWHNRLSGGQKQKIIFAKILLQKPEWLFLDEASAFLDENSERNLYQLIREHKDLKNTTIVSIAHRSTVKTHHDRIITLGVNENKELVIISDERSKKSPMLDFLSQGTTLNQNRNVI